MGVVIFEMCFKTRCGSIAISHFAIKVCQKRRGKRLRIWDEPGIRSKCKYIFLSYKKNQSIHSPLKKKWWAKMYVFHLFLTISVHCEKRCTNYATRSWSSIQCVRTQQILPCSIWPTSLRINQIWKSTQLVGYAFGVKFLEDLGQTQRSHWLP